MSLPSIHSSFGPSAWGGLDALAPAAASTAVAQPAIGSPDGLFARHDDAALLGVSAAPLSSTPAEFRDRLLACLCEAG